MITTTYNFRQWFNRTYPDHKIYAVYGLKAYIIDKPMNPEHMFEYNVQQLPSGQYIIFVGATPERVMELMKDITTEGLNYSRPREGIPTTFAAFEAFLNKCNVRYMHRTHCANATANELLHMDNNDPLWNRKHHWYMYEFDASYGSAMIKFKGPMTVTTNNTVVILVKSSYNGYVSKKQLFMEKFRCMQPLYEQLIAACAKEEWDTAANLAAQYMCILFEEEDGTVDVEQLKQAYRDNTVLMFIKIRTNLR